MECLNLFEDGKLKFENLYLNGKKEGLQKSYFKNGNKRFFLLSGF